MKEDLLLEKVLLRYGKNVYGSEKDLINTDLPERHAFILM